MPYPDNNIDYQNTSAHAIYYALISNSAYVTFNIYWISFQFKVNATISMRNKFGNNEWSEWR